MAYNVITKDQVLNGLPLDQNVISTAIKNQEYLKSEADANDDLSALARNIVPDADNTRNIGSLTNQIANIYSRLIDVDKLVLTPGLSSNLSVVFANSSTTGLYSPAVGSMRFRSNGYDAVDIDSSRTKLIGSNRSQLHIESTSTGFEAVHTIGANAQGIIFTDVTSSPVDLFEISQAATKLYTQLQALDGSESAPSISFAGSLDSGFFRGVGTVAVAVDGVDRLSIGQSIVVGAEKVIFPDGTEGSPSIIFSGNEFSGLSYDLLNSEIQFSLNQESRFAIGTSEFGIGANNATSMVLNIANDVDPGGTIVFKRSRGTQDLPSPPLLSDLLGDIIFNGSIDASGTSSDVAAKMCAYAAENFSVGGNGSFITFETTKPGAIAAERKLEMGKPTVPQVNITGSFGTQKKVINVAGTYSEENVEDFSTLKVDTSLGNITLSTLGGGVDTQLLFIFKSDAANTLTIQHNSAAAGQKILTQNQTDLVLGAGYGGAILINDEGTWKEISIS